MAINFPSNPSTNDIYTFNGKSWIWNGNSWTTRSPVVLDSILNVDVASPTVGDILKYNGSYWTNTTEPTLGVQTYTTIAELPLTGNETGAQAFVSENNRLYIWSGTGWYNIALVNTSPTAITGANGNYAFATDGTPIVLTLVSTDPEGLPLTWSYSVTSGSLENGGGTTATVSQAANVFTITPTTTEDYAGEFSLTFTASDGVNLATATSSFALTFAILNSKYTSLMLKTSGTNAQQNNTFIDSSTNNFTITSTGNTTQGTFSPYGDKWSNYFDGSGDYLTVQDSTPTAGDATVEFWIYPVTQVYGGDALIIGTLNNAQGTWAVSFAGSSRLVTVWADTYSGAQYNSNTTANLNAWNHIALVKQSGVIYLYVNGVKQTGSYSQASSFGQGSSVVIGAYSANGGQNYTGYISNVRIVYGTALYTANFTPPTEPLTAIAGTRLLTCQSNSFKDNSTNNFAITRNGDVRVQRFSPYDIESYNPAVIGGSAYFDGAGDYLTGTSSNEFIASGNGFTAECWVYYTSISNYSFILASTTGANNYNPYWYIGSTNTGNWRVSWGDASSVDTGVAIKTNSWNHVAMSMASNGSGTLYVNGTSIATTTGKTLNGAATAVAIAHGGGSLAGQYLVSGYVADVRYVKNSSVYTANFTPPTAPLTAITNTSLLLKNTNAGIYDTSGNNVIETVGNAQVSTAVTKYGSSSMYFDGTGDYLPMLPGPAFAYDTGNFTIEAWVYPQSFASEPMIWSQTADGQNYFLLHITSGGTPSFRFGSGGGTAVTSSVAVSLNTWSHISVVREGVGANQLKLYVNGVNTATSTCAWDFTNITYIPAVGRYSHSASLHFTGYIEDLRITKGLARYTANFTPPTSELSI